MFAIEVEYLARRVVATARDDRTRAEWPPHPGRLFSALVAAAFDTFSEDGRTLPREYREALEWLESLPPPSLAATDARARDSLSVFVPNNDDNEQFRMDKGRPKFHPAIGDRVGIRRYRQERYFPTVIPDEPLVHFIWPTAVAEDDRRMILDRLVAAVTYLGHSSSQVRLALTDQPGAATFIPDPDGTERLRVPAAGRLRELERDFARGTRPSPGTYASYRRLQPDAPQPLPVPAESVFGDMAACQLGDGPFLPLCGALRLTDAVRRAVIERTDAADARVRTLVSGHTADGDVSREDHVAYVPLANVDHRHADGRVMGFAVVLPRRLPRFGAERRAILAAVAGIEAVGFGAHTWPVSLSAAGEGPWSLQPAAYAGPARCWATVTPVLCDRFPKDRDGRREADVIADSVERVVGVRPAWVLVDRVSRHRGVPLSHTFLRRREDDDRPRHRVHVALGFDRDVLGPLLVGAGRYLGLGLFRPWRPCREGRR